jgi:hypothetical protein
MTCFDIKYYVFHVILKTGLQKERVNILSVKKTNMNGNISKIKGFEFSELSKLSHWIKF